MENGNSNSSSNVKVYIAIAVALILLLLGFYLYYFYPQVIPGMASTSLKQDLSVLVVGLDDTESVSKGEISADSIVLAQLFVETNEIKLTNIVMGDRSFGEDIQEHEKEQLIEDIKKLTSTDLNYYFMISYQGFVNLVENIGGITIMREEDLKISDLNLELSKGSNDLSGQEALNYARWYDYRKDEKDRVERQQQVISALIDNGLKDKTLLDIPQLFTTTVDTFNSVETNLEFATISNLIEHLINNKNYNIIYDIIIENGKQ